MRFKTEYRIFVESSKTKPKTFSEYISNQIAHGSDINLEIKGVFDMLDLLYKAKAEFEEELKKVPNHEEEIKEKVRVYEEKVRVEFKESDEKAKNELNIQIKLLNKLITDYEAEAETDSEQSEQNEGV